jgi:hypothetical protein
LITKYPQNSPTKRKRNNKNVQSCVAPSAEQVQK